MANIHDTQEIEIPESAQEPIKLSTAEQLRDSLQYAQTYIQGLENMIDDLLPGWREQPDDELPAYIQAFHEKYKRMEKRSAKLAADLEFKNKQSESLFKRIDYLRRTLGANNIEYEGK